MARHPFRSVEINVVARHSGGSTRNVHRVVGREEPALKNLNRFVAAVTFARDVNQDILRCVGRQNADVVGVTFRVPSIGQCLQLADTFTAVNGGVDVQVVSRYLRVAIKIRFVAAVDTKILAMENKQNQTRTQKQKF